jgi:DNA-binding LytR/AlgR family response regulator
MKPERISVLVVEADAESGDVIEFHLRSIADIDIAGIAHNAAGALQIVSEAIPDIIMTDIDLPDKNGFELLDEIRQRKIFPGVIVCAESQKHCIQAIRSAVFDYLLKPINPAELMEAMSRFRQQHNRAGLEEKLDRLVRLLNRHEKIRFNTRHGFMMIDPSEIVYCQADWSYTEIFLQHGKVITVSMNIGKVEELLDTTRFIRVSRSVIINISTLLSVDRKTHTCIISAGEQDREFRITSVHLRNLDGFYCR